MDIEPKISEPWLDRLKSILMGKAFSLRQSNRDELIKELHTIWRHVETIGLRQELETNSVRWSKVPLKSRRLPKRF